jgi:hypothetical protein
MQKLPVLFVEHKSEFRAKKWVLLKARAVADELYGNFARFFNPRPIASKRCKLKIVAALLALPHDCALATQVKIYLC